MKRRKLLDRKLILSLLDYDPVTGLLTWKERPASMFRDGGHTAIHSSRTWNTKNAGKVAFSSHTCHGYFIGAINGKLYLAHRIVWKMAYGTEPHTLDHINGNPRDNRLENRRAVSHQENSKNMKLPNNNTSGCVGVSFHKQTNKWRAYITVDRQQHPLGLFLTKEEAIAARLTASKKEGYHKNHGRAGAFGVTPEQAFAEEAA